MWGIDGEALSRTHYQLTRENQHNAGEPGQCGVQTTRTKGSWRGGGEEDIQIFAMIARGSSLVSVSARPCQARQTFHSIPILCIPCSPSSSVESRPVQRYMTIGAFFPFRFLVASGLQPSDVDARCRLTLDGGGWRTRRIHRLGRDPRRGSPMEGRYLCTLLYLLVPPPIASLPGSGPSRLPLHHPPLPLLLPLLFS